MSDLAILVPVLRRPHRVAPLLDSIRRSCSCDATVLFIADPDDDDEIAALKQEGAEFTTLAGGYAAKINFGVEKTTEPLLFLGADDLVFREGWYQAACAKLSEADVIGVADLIPRRRDHATHFLVTRAYAEQGAIDASGLLSEAYDHSFVDDELIATAQHRGAYAYAPAAVVEHLHPMAGGEDDDIYRKGRANFRLDRRIFNRRSALWM